MAADSRRQEALARGTQDNYGSMTKLFTLFRLRHGLPVFQPSPSQFSEYIEYLAAAGYVPKTIRSHVTAIKRLHDEKGLPFDAHRSFTIRSHLEGIDKSLAYQVKQAPSITPDQLEALIFTLRKKPGSEPFVFAITLAFTTFIRQANLAPPSPQAFNRNRHTTKRDIVTTKSGLGLVVFWTKTGQIARSPDIIPIPVLKGSPLCPNASWLAYQQATTGVPMDGPLLVTSTSESGRKRKVFQTISLQFLRKVFTQAASEAGLPRGFTLHSLRRGGSLICYKEGASLPDVMLHGTWASDAIWTYLAKESAWTSTVMSAWESITRKRAALHAAN